MKSIADTFSNAPLQSTPLSQFYCNGLPSFSSVALKDWFLPVLKEDSALRLRISSNCGILMKHKHDFKLVAHAVFCLDVTKSDKFSGWSGEKKLHTCRRPKWDMSRLSAVVNLTHTFKQHFYVVSTTSTLPMLLNNPLTVAHCHVAVIGLLWVDVAKTYVKPQGSGCRCVHVVRYKQVL